MTDRGKYLHEKSYLTKDQVMLESLQFRWKVDCSGKDLNYGFTESSSFGTGINNVNVKNMTGSNR